MSKLASMTGFATRQWSIDSAQWTWELRSVNARGLELRFRLPPGLDRLENELRAVTAARLKRGTVAASLRVAAAVTGGITIDRNLLETLIAEADKLAVSRPGTPPPRIELLMALPGVMRRDAMEAEPAPGDGAVAAIKAGFEAALNALIDSRLSEGGRLETVLLGQLAQLEVLHAEAGPQAAQQAAAQRARLIETLRGLLAEWPAPPEERLAQELALLASRCDVTEEIDRLCSHIQAARRLCAEGGPQGRALDFLVQEFMREANTLCSKSASIGLTTLGLQIKGVVEQMREQVQNVE